MKKSFWGLLMLLFLLGCTSKVDYAFFEENDTLIYVMKHTDKTKEEFERDNKREISMKSDEKAIEELYSLLTPSLTLYSNENVLPRVDFQYGSIYDWITDRMEVKYEIDEKAEKLIISGKIKSGDGQNAESFVYTFRILDCETLEFVEKESSDITTYVDPHYITVSDGAIFCLEK